MSEGFVKFRNGIKDHIGKGLNNPFDLGVYSYLQLHCDYETGIYFGCSSKIAVDFGDISLQRGIKRSLAKLKKGGYINYKKGTGERLSYNVLIDKFEITAGKLLGYRLNAWFHGDLVQRHYEPKNGASTGAGTGVRSGARPIVLKTERKKEKREEQSSPATGFTRSDNSKSNSPGDTPDPPTENFAILDFAQYSGESIGTFDFPEVQRVLFWWFKDPNNPDDHWKKQIKTKQQMIKAFPTMQEQMNKKIPDYTIPWKWTHKNKLTDRNCPVCKGDGFAPCKPGVFFEFNDCECSQYQAVKWDQEPALNGVDHSSQVGHSRQVHDSR